MGLGPAIHVFVPHQQDVGARDNARIKSGAGMTTETRRFCHT
jgi:hypothetical protein